MKEYTYPILNKLLYRYGNIPLTLFLSVFLIQIIVNIDSRLILILPLVVTLLLIYFLNRQYLNLYKIIPYRIRVSSDKMICDQFIFSKREVEISFTEITSLTGGIFHGRLNGVMKMNTERNICIGFFNSIRNAKELERTILTKVKPKVYKEVVARVDAISGKHKPEPPK